jgi:hypothetical protein
MAPAELQGSEGLEVRDPEGRRLGVVTSVREASLVVQTGRAFLYPKKVVVQAADLARREGSLLVLGRSAQDYIGPPLRR